MSGEGVAGLAGLLILLAIVPGPSDLLVAGCAARRGYAAAWTMVAGILLADVALIAIALLGLSALVASMASASVWLEAMAALPLLGFGVSMLLAKPCSESVVTNGGYVRGGSFAAGFAVTFLDPKALLFYFGVLPTFFEVERIGWVEAGLLFAFVSGVICLTKGGYAWLGARGARLMPSPAYQRAAYRVLGSALVAIGVGVAMP